MSQLDEMMAQERKQTEETATLVKSLAMLKHNLKEVNENWQRKSCFLGFFWKCLTFYSRSQSTRKMENEMDLRKKVEAQLLEARKKLEEEQSKRTRELNNNQQVNEKIIGLEKQVSYLLLQNIWVIL